MCVLLCMSEFCFVCMHVRVHVWSNFAHLTSRVCVRGCVPACMHVGMCAFVNVFAVVDRPFKLSPTLVGNDNNNSQDLQNNFSNIDIN